MKCRPAFTLAELVMVMTAGSVLLTLSIGTVHRSMTIHREGEARVRGGRTVARLARDFRRDLRQAASAELDGTRLTLAPPEGVEAAPIIYEVVDHRLIRRQQRGEDAVRQEVYELTARAEFSLATVPETSQIRLVVSEATPLGEEKTRLLAIVEATPGAGGVMQ